MLLETRYTIGGSVYATIRRDDGKYLAGTSWVTLSADAWASLGVALDEVAGTGVYVKDVTLPAGNYRVTFYARAGQAPAAGDNWFAQEDFPWDGSAPLSLSAVKLAPTGLDSISTAGPSGLAGTFREMAVAVWRRLYAPTDKDVKPGFIRTLTDEGGVVTEQAYTADAQGRETVGKARVPLS